MNKHFEEDYEARIAIEREFDEAKTDEAREIARTKMQSLNEAINNKGENYCRILEAFLDMKERKNELLDFGRRTIWEKDIPKIVESLKENGIETFTFSARCTDAIETAAKFEEAGCHLIGLTKINDYLPELLSGEYKKMPALLFNLR
jgi:hypothetical protein